MLPKSFLNFIDFIMFSMSQLATIFSGNFLKIHELLAITVCAVFPPLWSCFIRTFLTPPKLGKKCQKQSAVV